MTLATAPAVSTAPATVLSVRNLSINAKAADGGVIELVRDVSFDVYENEVLGIVGESGSGKSLTMLAVLGLLAPGLSIAGGSIVLRGQELTSLSFAELRKVRGKSVSIIFQDPLTTLNPVLKIGRRDPGARHRVAVARGYPKPRTPCDPVSERVFGRHAPARGHRHGHGQ
jgi:peptide/nickel transport system ATP-binding protein